MNSIKCLLFFVFCWTSHLSVAHINMSDYKKSLGSMMSSSMFAGGIPILNPSMNQAKVLILCMYCQLLNEELATLDEKIQRIINNMLLVEKEKDSRGA